MKDDFYKYTTIGLICFIMGFIVAILPPSTAVINGTVNGNLYTEYKNKVYRLVDPDIYSKQEIRLP